MQQQKPYYKKDCDTRSTQSTSRASNFSSLLKQQPRRFTRLILHLLPFSDPSRDSLMGSSNTGSKDDSDTETDPKIDSQSDSGIFTEGEKVLAYHGPCIYEAKVQKVDFTKEEPYYVHYLGWNKSWDEWVGMDRLLKCTEENLRKQKVLNKKLGTEKNPKSGRSMQSRPKSSTEARADKEDPRNYGGRSKKRKVESGMEEKDTVSTGKHVKIQIPSTLKKQLLDDYEFVTQLGKLVKLPRDPCVEDILKKYHDYKSKKDAVTADSIGEIVKGLQCYFDKALPVLLLYKKEVQQYQEAIVDNISPSTVYGAEHLLRLFVKLPEILTCANIDEETMNPLMQSVHDFLKFLLKNHGAFFVSSYEVSQGVEVTLEEEDD